MKIKFSKTELNADEVAGTTIILIYLTQQHFH